MRGKLLGKRFENATKSGASAIISSNGFDGTQTDLATLLVVDAENFHLNITPLSVRRRCAKRNDTHFDSTVLGRYAKYGGVCMILDRADGAHQTVEMAQIGVIDFDPLNHIGDSSLTGPVVNELQENSGPMRCILKDRIAENRNKIAIAAFGDPYVASTKK